MRRNYNYPNQLKSVDFFVVLGVFVTLFIAFVNVQNYKVNQKMLQFSEEANKDSELKHLIEEIKEDINSEI